MNCATPRLPGPVLADDLPLAIDRDLTGDVDRPDAPGGNRDGLRESLPEARQRIGVDVFDLHGRPRRPSAADHGNGLDLDLKLWIDERLDADERAGGFVLSRKNRPMARLEVPLTKKLVAYAQWNSYDYQERTTLFPSNTRPRCWWRVSG